MPTESINSTASFLVQSEPKVEDPREMKTILIFSLRSLWGDLEPHSYSVTVKKEGDLMRITCASESLDAVRSAITMVTPPPYLETTIYRFDVVERIV